MSSTDPRFYCSLASFARGESLGGTALPSTRFLLVEHAGPWAFSAWRTFAANTAAGDTVNAWVDACKGRVQFIRRHRSGRKIPGTPSKVFLVADGHVWAGQWQTLDDLAAIVQADRMTGSPRGVLTAVDSPLVLVCAHSSHDVCCAKQGREVAREVSQQWPDDAWETTHLGGDRFAANVLLLPERVMLGRVAAEDAVDMVSLHRQGRMFEHITRGICGLPPAVQKAVITVVAEDSRLTYRDVKIAGIELVPTDGPTATQIHRIRLRVRDEDRVVVIAEGRSTPAKHSCNAAKLTSVRTLDVVPASLATH